MTEIVSAAITMLAMFILVHDLGRHDRLSPIGGVAAITALVAAVVHFS